MKTLPAIFASVIVFLSGVMCQAPPIPPPGLYCCPPTGPGGLTLRERQVGPYTIYCWYSDTVYCVYNPSNGKGSTIPGCPSNTPSNPTPPTCPV
ncbi:hypothetical protein CPB83DRAFT_861435 [Crepidotus variabilis]|uniref:Uncharacterized protein n=1 Tax=Crepidotus variabilis TaxID=179855 RepID=A0A9P6JL18_9AGAR|nr:hypothetical protein CPB83DRAFT_861435 [Crepidotus variabilis]